MTQKDKEEECFKQHYAKYSNDIDAEYAFPIDLSDYEGFAKEFYDLGREYQREQIKKILLQKVLPRLMDESEGYELISILEDELG